MAKKRATARKNDYLQAIRALDGDLDGRRTASGYLASTSLAVHGGDFAWAANPYVLGSAQVKELEEAARMMGSIMEKVMAKYSRDRSFRPLFGLRSEVEELTLVPSGSRRAVPLCRLDLFLDPSTNDYQICAIVTGGVDGMASSVEVARAIELTGSYRAYAQDHAIRTFDAMNECILAILHTYGKWANAQEGRNHPTYPSISVVDVPGSPRAAETAYAIDCLHEHGCYAHAAGFEELRIETVGGVEQLVDNHGPVTCVWLRATADEVAAHMNDGVRSLFAARRRGLVCTVGGYRSWPCCTRSFLQVLRTRECKALLSRDENAFVEKHIPHTTVIDASTDISAFYDQENWVLKCADGHAPESVLAGASFTRSAWRNRLVKSIKRHDAVQPYITQHPMEVLPGEPVEGAELSTTSMNVMLGAYVFEGRLAGVQATCGTGASIADWDDRLEMGVLVVEDAR